MDWKFLLLGWAAWDCRRVIRHFPEKSGCIAFLRRAVEMGQTFIDTSEVYSVYANEEIVDEALESVWDQVKIVAKFGWDIHDGK